MAFAVLNITVISHLYLALANPAICQFIILFCDDVTVPRWIITYPNFTKVNWALAVAVVGWNGRLL